jgi:Class II flagellar assembly regulator
VIQAVHPRQAARAQALRRPVLRDGFTWSAAPAAAEAAAAPQPVATTGAIGPLLALQDLAGAGELRGPALRRGERLLDILESLQGGLLHDAPLDGSLQQLARVLRDSAPPTDDPRLGDLLREIELRAAVEGAKLELAERRAR